ncbi:MAG: MBL fold metallo-hydrolase [Ilumatobacter sp.]|uniref:MBL fold metallo-hydrolase n=1 Tax=Ilumatobacter sp. TaxID=1967498 RepID=UPI00261E8E19|nr:MBL fold metallo-hydrolase [Ilumatobacter sp.]MDJ0767377.1 MBL fold metallo-hydrolase [Ilumatobacter sp.]
MSSRNADRHPHAKPHDHGHRSMLLAPSSWRPQRIHRIGRRQFLTELGRNAFAVAIVGGVVAACSSDDADGEAGTTDSAGTTATTPEGSPGTTAPASPTSPATTAASEGESEEPAAEQTPTDASVRWAQANLGFVSAYVLVRGTEAAVVDTGIEGSAGQIGDALATLGAGFDDVGHVVLTHRHPDHVGSLPEVIELAPTATAYAGAGDIPNITSPVDLVAVGDGDDVLGLQVYDTPGHTAGSISLLDPGIGLLIAGDALNGNDDGTGISGANEQFTDDMTTANASIAKLAALEFETALFGHGQPVETGAGALVRALATEL